jgi:acyl dehydratase
MSDAYIPSVYIAPTGAQVQRLDLKTLKVGDKVPILVRRGDFQHWNRYAAVNYEYAGHHMDDGVGIHEGFEAAIGMGPFINSLLHQMLREWVGEDVGRVVEVGMQSRRPWHRGRTLMLGGRVTAIHELDAEMFVKLDVWGDDDEGRRLTVGVAEIAVPK